MAEHLLDEGFRGAGLGSRREERGEPVAEPVDARLVAGVEQQHRGRHQLMGRQPVAAVADRDQVGEQVVARCRKPVLRQGFPTYAANSALATTASASCSGVRLSSYILTIACDHGRSRWRSASGPAEQLGDDEDRQRFGEVGDDVERPVGGEMGGAVVEQPGGQLLDPGAEAGHVAAAERALHETAQPGVLRRLTVEDRVGVQPVERLPLVVGFARPEDPAERPLPEDLAAGGVAGRDPDPEAAVPGDRRFGPEGGEGGVRVGDDVRVRQVQQLGGVHGDHDASVGSGAATCRGTSWSPVLRASMGRSAHSANPRNGPRGR